MSSDKTTQAKAKATKRKAEQRQREKALDISEVRLKLSATERATLDELCQVRAGSDEPYSRDEYVRLLILMDKQRLTEQLQQLDDNGPCARCGDPLPGGCNGLFKGEAACWYWPSNTRLKLEVKRPPLDLTKYLNK